MNRLGIKYQILLITLVPVLLVDILFTYIHISNSIDQQNKLMQNKGRIIARQVAGTVQFYLFSDNDGHIQDLLEQAVGADDIVLASVYDRQGRRLAESRAATFRAADSADYHYFHQPILSPRTDYAGIFGPNVDQARQPRILGWVNLYISRLQLQQEIMQVFIESSVFFVSVLLVAVLLTIVISRRITQPIFRLMEHLRFVETGQLGKTIEVTEANEIGALQKGFNRMSHALLANRRHLNRRIQQATQQLNEAITDLESRNRELGFARDLAQDANRTKSEFLANMSHEIRTPINGIKGFINLLGQSSLDPSQRRYVDIVMKSTSDLTSIVDEILDFSKMESGKLQIVDEVFDLYEVIEQTRDLLFINVLAKDIDLNLILFSDTPQWVIGDKLRLKQILLNLIGNAIKFTDQGRVVIRVSLEDCGAGDNRVLISVEDSGIGISEQDQQSLFKAFSQVESSDTRRFTGTGLGLLISKNLAQLMGGDISMHSTPGEGSRFSLSLPFEVADDQGPVNSGDAEAASVLIFAAEQNNLMEIRTLFDRAGTITEAELIDSSAGIDPILQNIQRNIAYIDLLVFDLRHFDLDLDGLLKRISGAAPRVIAMHYDPGYQLPVHPDKVEFVSIISTSRSIAEIVNQRVHVDDATEIPVDSKPATSQRKKVLLVDDNQINLKLASELMRLWGHEVHEADHAEQALEVYRQERFDLVILDIQMPDIDGISLLQMLRELDPADKTPMVALTANVLNGEADRLLELGFDYFLGKPIDEEQFRALLDGQPRRQPDAGSGSPTFAEETTPDCSLDYARSLELAAGNESLLQQILEILQRDIPEQRQHLRDSFASLDLDRLGALTHKLHGVTCYASLPRLRRIVVAFQQQLTGGTRDSLGALVETLDAELAAVESEVERYLRRCLDTALSG
jgi:two-component system sensor histidine kinase BarA